MSLLGALAAIWLSVLLGGLLIVLSLVAMAVNGAKDSSPAVNVERNSVLYIDLDGEITDRPTPVDIMSEFYGNTMSSIALSDLIAAIGEAADDPKIDGIAINCAGASAGLSKIDAIIEALRQFRRSGKWIYAYGDTYTQGNYFIASAADSIFINPQGMISVNGLSSTTLYYKGLLDKLGVDVQVVKVGTFKSAVEPFILTQSSEANRMQTQAFLGSMWGDLAQKLADNRGVDTTEVNRWADSYSFADPASAYLENRMADATLYRHEFDELITAATGLEPDDDPRYVSVDDYVKARKLSSLGHSDGKTNIAVLYAIGDITENGDGGIASSRLVPQILDLAEDDDVDGLVLRVNSGGGSAFASEQIWEALEQFKERTGKPFYVSMGDVAASGGYYISCGAHRIYADPLTLTGSIGIFGLIPDAHKLLNDKLGITSSTVATNRGAFPDMLQAMPAAQREAMQRYVDRGYETFVGRCAEGRNMSVDSIKAIAEGRVWDGRSALAIGLVDHLGGLMECVADMAASLDAGDDYRITEYPKLKYKWWEEMLQMSKKMQTSAVRSQLGEFAPIYDASQSLLSIDDPLQCRMEAVVIH